MKSRCHSEEFSQRHSTTRPGVALAKTEESEHSRFFEGKAGSSPQKDGEKVDVVLTNLSRCSLKEG